MKRITIALAYVDRSAGLVKRSATAYAIATPGLAVRRRYARDWAIDHIPTGKALPGAFSTRREAANRAERLGALCDWTVKKPRAELCGKCRNGTTRRGSCQRCDGLGMVALGGRSPASASAAGKAREVTARATRPCGPDLT